MSNKPMVDLPPGLRREFDTYFQTAKYAQANFTRFDRSMIMERLSQAASRYGYTIVTDPTASNFKGVFRLERPTREIRVSNKTYPRAEIWR